MSGIARIWIAAIVFSVAGAEAAKPNRVLVIKEVKRLRSQLPVNDPQRDELTLRLADLHADAGFDGTAEPAQAARDRREALGIYRERYSALSGQTKVRVGFQIGRILSEEGQSAQALPYFQSALKQSEDTSLRREAALRLAELSEESSPRDAEKYYRAALDYCEGAEACTYTHYRLSWALRNQGKIPEAMNEMRLALWDGRGQLRDEAVRDLLWLMANDPSRAQAHAAEIEALMVKSGQRSLLRDLAHAYLSAGKQGPAVEIMEVILGREQDLDLFIKYLDERYAVGPWEKVLSGIEEFHAMAMEKGAASVLKDPKNSEKAALRFAVQLDGDRATRPERSEAFQMAAEAALALFPQSKDRMKLVEGWLAAEKSSDKKLKKISQWLADPRLAGSPADRASLLDSHLGVAKKEKKNALVIEDLLALLDMGAVPTVRTKSREYEYALAYAYYEEKKWDLALERFAAIAQSGLNGKVDRWAVQSQNLILDIHNQRKDLAALQKQARLWTSNPTLAKNVQIAGDLAEMKKVADQAEFEEAVAAGESGDALVKFLSFCEQKRFTPKSCDNAKSLAVKMDDHRALLRVLLATGNKEELLGEWEAAGYFSEAARAREEKLRGSRNLSDFLRVGLLYELALDEASARRTLERLLSAVESGKIKSREEEQFALFQLLSDAGLAPSMDWTAPAWSKGVRDQLVEMRAVGPKADAKMNPKVRAYLLSQKTSTGPGWERAVRDEYLATVRSERAVRFHGKNSRQKFQERMKRLKSEGQMVDRYASGASLPLRVEMIEKLLESHRILEKEILESPIPNGLAEDQLKLVRSGLADMAKPFADRAVQIEKLLANEIAKGGSDAIATRAAAPVRGTPSSRSTGVDRGAYAKAIARLRENPKKREGVVALRDLFRKSGRETVALYFEGRLNDGGLK